MITPICIFCYKRKNELSATFQSLEKCIGVENYPIYVFSDEGGTEDEKSQVKEVRQYLTQQKSLQIKEFIFAEHNKGLAESIINGVNRIIQEYGRVIVIEDDLIVSPNFLLFMEQGLDFYQHDPSIFSISGYSPDLPILKGLEKDFYFTPRASSWGWATWKDRWVTIDWEVKTYNQFKFDLVAQWHFAKGGIDLPGMLRDQMKGRINSWAIRWVYQQYLNKQVSVFPKVSKVINIGFGKDATHTKKSIRFLTELDTGDQTTFTFENFKSIDPKINKQYRSIFSIWKRLIDRF